MVLVVHSKWRGVGIHSVDVSLDIGTEYTGRDVAGMGGERRRVAAPGAGEIQGGAGGW